MRRATAILLAVLTAVSLAAGVAQAESQTVQGKRFGGNVGDIKKMTVNNARAEVTTNVFGLGRPCGGAKQLSVELQTPRGKIVYVAEAGCYGVDWITNLYYSPTGDPQDLTRVRCASFAFTRNNTTGAFKIVMPRRCIDQAPDRIRVKAEGLDFGSVTGGIAGPTDVLARG